MRKLLALVLLLLLPAGVGAQVPEYPYPNFVPGAIIASGEVNANFGHVSDHALNRTGGVIEGHITVDPDVTIDGIDVSDYFDGLGRIRPLTLGTAGSPAFAPSGDSSTGLYVTGGQLGFALSGASRLLVSFNQVAVFGFPFFNSAGKIPALSSTYFGSLAAQDLQLGEASFTDGASLARLAAAEGISQLYTFQNTLGISQIWNNGGTTFNGLKVDITNTASAAGSAPLNVKVGGSERLKVDPTGKMVVSALQITQGAANGYFLVSDPNGFGTWTVSANASPVPAGMLAFFEAACPSGWTDRSAVYGDKFLRGGATYSELGGGADTHSHSYDPALASTEANVGDHTHTVDPASSTLGAEGDHDHSFSGSLDSTVGSHSHDFTLPSSGAFEEPNTGASTAASTSHTHTGTTGSTNIDHSHSTTTLDISAIGNHHSHSVDFPLTATEGASSTAHTHSLDIGISSTDPASNVPAYVQVLVCRKD